MVSPRDRDTEGERQRKKEPERERETETQKHRELEGEFDIYLLPRICVCKSHFGLEVASFGCKMVVQKCF
jgi:hypothetical protein